MTNFYKVIVRLSAVLLLITGVNRLSAATFPVINTNNSGAGSLAAAIIAANANPGPDDIEFAIPGGGPFTINLTTPLPPITQPTFINGYSQPGALPGSIGGRTILINIDGTLLPAPLVAQNIFVVNSDDVTIAGLALYGAPNYQIASMEGADNLFIWGNYIGSDNSGTVAMGGGGGIASNVGGSSDNLNLVVGTNGDGTDDDIEGNLISGQVGAEPNGFGVVLWQTENSFVSGNYIGLNKDGNDAGMGNSNDGILITVQSNGNIIGTDGDGVSDVEETNRIGMNGRHGILVAVQAENNRIAGNIIGISSANTPAGNAAFGIQLLNCSNNIIGTNSDGNGDAAEANIIGSNGNGGIIIATNEFFGFNFPASGHIIAGNIIGTDATQTVNLGNLGAGITIFAGTTGGGGALNISDNIIGSNNDGTNDAGEGNIITNNSIGVLLTEIPPSTNTGNKISRNSIFLNTELAIDIFGDGVSGNDDGDADAGPNGLLNAPVISTIQLLGGNLTITGFSSPNSVVEFYIADAGPNPNPPPVGYTKDFGEGRTFLFRAQDDATLDGVTDVDLATGSYDGNAEGTGAGGSVTANSFSFTIPFTSLAAPIAGNTRITALAYANAIGAGNTSEFGGVVSTSVLPVNLTSFRGRLNDNKAELTWTTAEEVDNSHFEIERSANGQAYTKVGTVKGNGGNNNVYHFTDNGPLSSVNYYRLKQVDIDGEFTYSRALVLRSDMITISAKAAPSPFTSFINLSYKLQKEENIRIRMIDQVGRVVKTYSTRGGAGVNTINLNGLDNLQKGTYIVELIGETVSFRQQVLKQ